MHERDMNTTDIIAEAKKRLAECEAEAAQLRRMIDAAEGTAMPVTGPSWIQVTAQDITGGGTTRLA